MLQGVKLNKNIAIGRIRSQMDGEISILDFALGDLGFLHWLYYISPEATLDFAIGDCCFPSLSLIAIIVSAFR